MSKRLLAILLVLVLLMSVLVACGKSIEAEPSIGEKPGVGGVETIIVNIATGGTGGTYYPLGQGLAKVYNNELKYISAKPQLTGASVENISLILEKEVEIAFIQNDITYYSAEALEMFDDKDKASDLRGMAIWYQEVIQIVASKASGIKTVGDLKGKKVAVGAPGSGTEANARQILEAHGITYGDIDVDYLSFSESAKNIQDGNVEAAFVTAGLPTGAIEELTESTDVTIVQVDPAKMFELNAKYPFYKEVIIKAGTYKDQTEDVVATAVMAMLVVHKDLDEDLMYELTKAMFENKEIIDKSHDRGKDLKLETALDAIPIELHPGAKRYYNERGFN